MASVTVINEIRAQLEKRLTEAHNDGRLAVVVGYTAQYAVYVHENLQAQHLVGQAKYLEQPARQFARDLGTLIAEAIGKGATAEEALLIAGFRLQRESQPLVPIDTGALRASAFTEVEK